MVVVIKLLTITIIVKIHGFISFVTILFRKICKT